MNKTNKLIGVCGAQLFEHNAISFLTALKKACIDTGYTTIALSASIYSADDNDDSFAAERLLDLCRYIALDCLIILTETLKNKHLIDKLVAIGAEKKIPVFSIDGTVGGCYNMTLDYETGFHDMVKHVILDHGAKRVNMLAGTEGNSFSEERVNIYKSTLAECGIDFEPERLAYGDFWDRPARVALQKFLDSDLPMPDAIICANDAMAITACSMLSERGYRIPEDIIVTGFDGTSASKYNSPTITTCEPDYEEALAFIMSETARVKADGVVSPCNHMINFRIMKNQSCGCEPTLYHNYSKIISKLYEANGDSAWHTLAMNTLVTDVSEAQYVEDIIRFLPNTVRLWSDHFRFACIKSELDKNELQLNPQPDLTGSFKKMTTMMYVKNHEFKNVGVQFNVQEFIHNFDELIEKAGTTFVIRILNYGKQVYGYTVDEFTDLDHRQVQRCNEFAMFLAHSIHTVFHNHQLNELNHNLARAYRDIETLSICDPLTGIYNRRGFFQMADTILDREKDNAKDTNTEKYLYLINIDLDGLKHINDNYGHSEGDFAITCIAHSLLAINAENLICSRFGGDEFNCIFTGSSPDEYNSETIKAQIIEALQSIPEVSTKKYPINFSIGLVSHRIDDALNIEYMTSIADNKMYEDKLSHKKNGQQL